jgi:hypothetical protein
VYPHYSIVSTGTLGTLQRIRARNLNETTLASTVVQHKPTFCLPAPRATRTDYRLIEIRWICLPVGWQRRHLKKTAAAPTPPSFPATHIVFRPSPFTHRGSTSIIMVPLSTPLVADEYFMPISRSSTGLRINCFCSWSIRKHY